MKLEEILRLDCNVKANRKLLMQKLLDIKLFEGYEREDITFELLEKTFTEISKKSYVRINMIMVGLDLEYYTCFLKDWGNDKNLPLCYGRNMREVYMKCIIYTYNLVKKTPHLRRKKNV